MLSSECRILSQGFRVRVFDHLDGASTNTHDLSPECDAKHSGESDRVRGAQTRSSADEVCRVAGAPMGTEEGGVGLGDGATGAPQYLRRNDLGPTSTMDHRTMARHVQLSERRFRAVQLDGGLSRGTFPAPSRPQRRILCGRLPEQPATTASRVPGPDCPPRQVYPGDDHDREYNLWSAGRRQRSGLGGRLPRFGAQIGKGGWET